jgi:hypothetical protein
MKARYLAQALLLMLSAMALPLASHADSFSIGIAVGFPPPPLPVYIQPPCPEPGYIWTPGYWAYDDDYGDYYWVPGTWVYAPAPGLLWTPGYWSDGDYDEYVWHPGYWAPHVGFYGGINYGYGYFGIGFVGGYWRDRDFYYNRAVANVVNIHVTNIYNNTEFNRYGDERTSFNGRQGIRARPTERELQAQRELRRGWTLPQQSHALQARTTPGMLASSNRGRPPVAATPRPGVFAGRGIVAASSSTAPLPHTYRGFKNSGARAGRAPAPLATPMDSGHSLGQPAHNDRPSWAAPSGGAGPNVPRWSPPPAPSAPAVRDRHDTRLYPPAGATGAPPNVSPNGSPNAYRAPMSPPQPNAAARPPVTQWNRPKEGQPNYQGRPNANAWQTAPVPPNRAYGVPAAPPRAVEQRGPQGYRAASPQAARLPPPAHARTDESRHDERQR